MAGMNLSVLLMISVCMVAIFPRCIDGFGKLGPPKSNPTKNTPQNVLFYCLAQQGCECGLAQKFEPCYQELTKKTRDYLVDEMNSCGMGVSVEYGSLVAWMDILCPVERNVTKACYDIVNPKFMERMSTASLLMDGAEEAEAVENARKCVESIMAFCSAYPDGCMD